MLVLITVENGVKKAIPLTADAGAGNPVGSLLHTYKKSNPSGYLYCDGSTFDQTKYPLLYAYLGTNVLPDYRECVEVGAEQNTTDMIATHDVYTEGQFKDDQLQEHNHDLKQGDTTINKGSTTVGNDVSSLVFGNGTVYGYVNISNNGGRKGTTTHGKQKAVFVYIKATSGISENAQDNVINTLNEERSYSTEEVNTGKKWIDGKPIYRKVVILPFTNSVATRVQVSSEVSASDYQVIDLGHSYIYDADYGTRQPWASNATTQTNMYISSGRLSFETTHPSGTLYAVCEYTKTN